MVWNCTQWIRQPTRTPHFSHFNSTRMPYLSQIGLSVPIENSKYDSPNKPIPGQNVSYNHCVNPEDIGNDVEEAEVGSKGNEREPTSKCWCRASFEIGVSLKNMCDGLSWPRSLWSSYCCSNLALVVFLFLVLVVVVVVVFMVLVHEYRAWKNEQVLYE